MIGAGGDKLTTEPWDATTNVEFRYGIPCRHARCETRLGGGCDAGPAIGDPDPSRCG